MSGNSRRTDEEFQVITQQYLETLNLLLISNFLLVNRTPDFEL